MRLDLSDTKSDFLQREIETMPVQQIKENQLKKVQAIINKAYLENPYYKNLCIESDVMPSDIKNYEDIQKLPFLDKASVRNAYPFKLLLTEQKNVVEYHTTSGTTGKAIGICATKEDMDRWAEVNARSLWMCGCRPGDVMLMSFAYGLATGIGFQYGAQLMGMGVVPGGIGRTDFLVDLIKDFKVNTITTTPSYGLYLEKKAMEKGIDIPKDCHLKNGLFGAEPWPESTRQKLEDALGIEAYNEFGMGEFLGPGMACECKKKNGMHVWSDHILVECIDPNTGEWVDGGEEGELVFSWIGSETCAMLRYRSHDIASVQWEECECGRTHPRLGRILGRSDDGISISGYVVFPTKVEEMLSSIDNLGLNFRMIIETVNRVDHLHLITEVSDNEILLSAEATDILTKTVIKSCKTELGMTPSVKLVETGSLPRDDENGKTASKRVEDRRAPLSD